MSGLSKLCVVGGLVLSLVSGVESSLASPDDVIEARKISKPPVLDGRLTRGEWSEAFKLSGAMHQIQPTEGGKPSKPSDIYVAYDADNLYIAARLYDDPDEITARQMIEGAGMSGEDAFKVILSPFNNNQSGYFFKVNPNGIREDALFEGAHDKNFNWDAIWYVRTSIDDKGWVAEMQIPFKSLNFDPKNTEWGFSFGRDISRLREKNAWTSYDRKITVDTAGVLKGIEGAEQGRGLDIVGSLSARRFKDYETGAESFRLEPSVDAFFKITPSLTAVMTVNTDFSATDVDGQVVNLSRFSVFFPEKRDFFLQDADLFTFGNISGNGRPFFSRTIGLGDEGEELALRAGGKLTGRIGDWDIGLLDVIQENYLANGNSNLFVGRVQRRLWGQSYVGMIFTHGDPLTGRGAYTLGADFNYRDNEMFEGKVVTASLWGQMSHTPDTEEESGNKAYGLDMKMESSNGFAGGLTYQHIGENFDPAMGFVNRPGIDKVDYWVNYTWRPNVDWIKRIQPRLWQGHWYGVNGDLQTRGTYFRPFYMQLKTNDSFSFSMTKDTDVLTEAFEIVDGVIIPVGRYDFDQRTYIFDSSGERVAGITLGYSEGEYYTGKKTSKWVGVRVQPNKYLKVTGFFRQNAIALAEGAFKTKQYSINTSIAFSSQLSWVTQLQYNNVSKTAALYSRLRYNPAPGQDVFLIVNHGMVRDDITDRFRSTTNQIGGKVGYTLRF